MIQHRRAIARTVAGDKVRPLSALANRGMRASLPPSHRPSFNKRKMPETPFRENLRGIVTMIACNLLFLINDTLLKVVNGDGLPLGEILFFRGLFVSALLLPLVLYTGAHRQIALLRSWPMFWRTVSEIGAAGFYLLALFHIPIANANTIAQVVPLLVTAAGAIFLGEIVGWRRWTAIIVGFGGVIIVMRPGFAGFSAFSLLTLASAFCVTLRDMTTRVMPHAVPALLIALVTGACVGLSGPLLGVAIGETWVAPPTASLGLIVVAVFFLLGGYLTSIATMRHGDISVVAPFRYTVIIWAIVVGLVVWGEIPDWPMIVGTVVIAASGIYTFSRERSLSRLRVKAVAGEGL
jgi:drug/metabolite transporter (DMT)-like permease